MSYTLPNFVNVAKFWTGGHTPFGHPTPDVIDVPCQHYWYSRTPFESFPSVPLDAFPTMIIRLPLLAYTPVYADILALDAYPTEYYKVGWIQKIHIGFTNEYKVALVMQCDSAGTVPRPP